MFQKLGIDEKLGWSLIFLIGMLICAKVSRSVYRESWSVTGQDGALMAIYGIMAMGCTVGALIMFRLYFFPFPH